MIDWDRVSILRDEVGGEAFNEVVTMFLDEVEETLSTLSTATPVADLLDALHFLKGSALSLGFRTFAALCHNGDQAAPMQTGELDTLLGTYRQSKTEFLTGLAERFSS
ncbi:Hpt domain-containing protein [Actibacterium ureilyticum]|uniref:Hpt domain-containing protein n=1 Tax=Actibacterium ureilyticum TaxID=1590614 RepID=UPI000BAB03F2|nr:Hpt domain-containing protein [Actibacterium ureilyticum]